VFGASSSAYVAPGSLLGFCSSMLAKDTSPTWSMLARPIKLSVASLFGHSTMFYFKIKFTFDILGFGAMVFDEMSWNSEMKYIFFHAI
jgi:hypothetical protein